MSGADSSRDDGFLSRWSRRKAEARTPRDEPAVADEVPPTTPAVASEPAPRAAAASRKPGPPRRPQPWTTSRR
jgi:hypothetical protein